MPRDLTGALPEDLLADFQSAVLAQDPAGDLGMGGGPCCGGGVPGKEVDVVAARIRGRA